MNVSGVKTPSDIRMILIKFDNERLFVPALGEKKKQVTHINFGNLKFSINR